MHQFSIFLITFFTTSLFLLEFSNARIFSLEMHHRFSEPVKNWYQNTGSEFTVHHWPLKGSVEYYEQLFSHDRALRGRRVSEFKKMLTFADGNSTFRLSSLGFLHYTTVKLGTPGSKFMVALDTGSDLFWVPCECGKCASTDDELSDSDFELSTYRLNESSTGKKVSCSNSLCSHNDVCQDTLNQCPYSVSYVSSETSTSGILVEDVLHLKSEINDQEVVQAEVIFGCGQVQTGSFLDVAAPNGLFGLGFEKISVPSLLSNEGYIANSFSMCFGRNGAGRINFGDKGSIDQEETLFNMNPLHPTYNVTVGQIRVGTSLFDLEFTALFDSGTSFTYLVDPAYTKLSESFHQLVEDKRRPPDPRIPFEYCYDMRSENVILIGDTISDSHTSKNSLDANTSLIPTMSLTMKGGAQYVIFDPIIIISTQKELLYCLAVVKSHDLNIIGQNFMTGYRIVFDREKLVLGWKKFDCYDVENSNVSLSKPQHTTNVPPAVAADPGSSSSFTSPVHLTSTIPIMQLLYASMLLLHIFV